MRLDLEINSGKLADSLSKQYCHKLLDPKTGTKGGDTAEKIIEFFRWANYSDRIVKNDLPFLGSNYGLKIFPNKGSGIVLKFGY